MAFGRYENSEPTTIFFPQTMLDEHPPTPQPRSFGTTGPLVKLRVSSSNETLVVSHLRLSAGRCWFSTSYSNTHKSGRSCQYWGIHSCRRIQFGKRPGAVCLQFASFRSFVFVLPCFIFTQAGSFSPLLNPSCCTLS